MTPEPPRMPLGVAFLAGASIGLTIATAGFACGLVVALLVLVLPVAVADWIRPGRTGGR